MKLRAMQSLALFGCLILSPNLYGKDVSVRTGKEVLKQMKGTFLHNKIYTTLKTKHPEVYLLVKNAGTRESILDRLEGIEKIPGFKLTRTDKSAYEGDTREETSYSFALEMGEGQTFKVEVTKFQTVKRHPTIDKVYDSFKHYSLAVEYVDPKSTVFSKDGRTVSAFMRERIFYPTSNSDGKPDPLSQVYYDAVRTSYPSIRRATGGNLIQRSSKGQIKEINRHLEFINSQVLLGYLQMPSESLKRREAILRERDEKLTPERRADWQKIRELENEMSQVWDMTLGRPKEDSAAYAAVKAHIKKNPHNYAFDRDDVEREGDVGPAMSQLTFHGCRLYHGFWADREGKNHAGGRKSLSGAFPLEMYRGREIEAASHRSEKYPEEYAETLHLVRPAVPGVTRAQWQKSTKPTLWAFRISGHELFYPTKEERDANYALFKDLFQQCMSFTNDELALLRKAELAETDPKETYDIWRLTETEKVWVGGEKWEDKPFERLPYALQAHLEAIGWGIVDNFESQRPGNNKGMSSVLRRYYEGQVAIKPALPSTVRPMIPQFPLDL